jgi:hypothetical protein
MCTNDLQQIPYTKEFKGATPTSKKRWHYSFDCPSCGKHTTKVKSPNFKFLCSSCSHSENHNTENYINKAKERFGDKYTYENTVYSNAREKVTITCPEHGNFTSRPSDFLNSKIGCPLCAKDSQNKAVTMPLEHYTKNLPKHITIVSYDEIGYHKPITLNCAHHGEFTTTFGALKGKFICKKCASNSHQKQSIKASAENQVFGRLYYVYIPSIDMYKLGVTTYKSSSLAGVQKEIIWEKWFSYSDAIELEHAIHTELAEFRYNGTKKLLRSGNTELYKYNVESKILDIINRASQKEFCVEKILNGETPTSTTEDNSVLNQE